MTDLTTRRQALLDYARSCLEAGDWHGCRDACTDLEVIEARIQERAGRKHIDPFPDYPPFDPNGRLERNWITPESCLVCGEPKGHGNLSCPQLQAT